MQKAYIDKIRAQIDIFNSLDLNELLTEKYPDKIISDIIISRFNGEQLVIYTKEAFGRLEKELVLGNLVFYHTSTIDINGNNIDFLNTITSFVQLLKSKDFVSAENLLWSIINYEIRYNIWHEKYDISFRTTKVRNMFEKLDLKKGEYDTHLKSVLEKLLDLQKQLKDDLESVAGIKDALNQSESDLSAIQKIKESYKKIDEDIKNLQATIEANSASSQASLIEKLKDLDSKSITVIDKINAKLADAEKLHSDIKTDLDEIQNLYSKAEKNSEYIQSKIKEAEDLAGKTADNALAFTFSERADKLKVSVRFWSWVGIPVAFLLMCAWIIFAYKYVNVDVNNDFAKLLVFTGKLALGLTIVCFAFREYMKERKLLEEYAFKKAVALTVNAYADQISHNNIPDNECVSDEIIAKYAQKKEDDRQQFIETTVTGLYEKPTYSIEKDFNKSMLRPRDLLKNKLLEEPKK